MLLFDEEIREQARQRMYRIMDVGAGFGGGDETKQLLKKLEQQSDGD